ncbi:MAG: AbrB/MazE/SpoVT family DNA-binding domain-containing protein [Methanomicrobiaceae archaeon]|nr:AbrB/MazE/SpoVT family DNA-binding domain-containing protein [Methanomicrobiaceae archaeon]
MPAEGDECTCTVEAVVSIDARGQMVLPKEVREMAEISPGERLLVITWKRNGRVCCISLVKAGELRGAVHDLLGPFMEEQPGGR